MSSIFTGSVYKATLLWDILKHAYDPKDLFPWWNRVDKYLYLGAIPLINKNHLVQLKELGVSTVITVLEQFEMETDTYISQPVKQADWEANDVVNHIVETPDYNPIELKKIIDTVDFMHSQIKGGHTIYIHCKSGKGRSPTLLACYILKYGLSMGRKFDTPDEVIEYIKEKRTIINLNDSQKKIIYEYWQTML